MNSLLYKLNKVVKQYLPTIIISLAILIAVCMLIELELLFRTEKEVTFSELNVENLSKFCTIEELEKKLAQNPDDYILNIRLGQMYESIGKLDIANDFYKSALRLSNRSNFAIYSYAMFCAKNNMYVFAATLAEELDDTSKRANYFKAKIYEEIADALDELNNYPAAVKSYQVVYKYTKSLNDKKYLNLIAQKYADEFIKLADYNMQKKDYEEAASNLKNSLLIKKSALANYKLGLIYLSNDKKLAEKYINQAFFENPYIVNPYIYNKLLNELIKDAESTNDSSVANYYNSRLKRFKILLDKVYLYKDQIVVENSAFVTQKTFFNKVKNKLFFEIKNNTDKKIEELYIKAELYVNGKKYLLEKKCIDKAHLLEPYSDFIPMYFDLDKEIDFNNLTKNDDVFIRFFAKKTKNAPWILIKIDFPNI